MLMATKDKFFENLLGFRKTLFLLGLDEIKMLNPLENFNVLLKEIFSEEEIKEILSILEDEKFCYFFYYLRKEIDLWQEGIPQALRNQPLLETSHSRINLEDYIKSLDEIKEFCFSQSEKTCFKKAFEFLNRGKVSFLDLGCGSGYYTKLLAKVYKSWEYFLLDRKEILEINRKELVDDLWFVDFSFLTGDFENLHTKVKTISPDIIFLSEVIHGKSWKNLKEKFFPLLKSSVKEGSYLVINELIPRTGLSKLFSLQMKLHSGGELYSEIEMIKLADDFGFKYVRTIKFSMFYYLIFFERRGV